MADVASLGIVVELKDGQLVARKLDEISNAADRTEKQAKSLTATIKGLAATLGVGIIARAELQNIIEAQNAMAQLEARVKSTGGAAGLTVKQLDDLSGALQDVTTYSDEAVKGAEAMLLTFGKVKGDTFGRATKDILDLAQAMGGDLQGAAVQVGKALQDPEQGLLALRRSGVSFTQAQQDTIKALFDTGKEAEAQAMILQELEKEFGGSAEAARNTLGGALTGLGNAFGDLFERTKDETSGLTGFINGLTDATKQVKTFHVEVKTAAEVLGAAGLLGALYKLSSGTALSAFLSLAATVTTYTEAVALADAATVGLGPKLATLAATMGPIALLFTAGALAVYDINKAFEAYDEKVDESTKNTKEYVDYLKALGRAQSHKPAPTTGGDDTAEQTKQLKALLAERQTEIDRQNALNAAYNQGDVALAKINAHYDRMAQDAKDAVDHHDKELDALKRLNAEREQATVVAAQLAAAEKDRQDTIEKNLKLGEDALKQLKDTNAEWTLRAKLYEQVIALDKELNAAKENGYGVNAANNAKKMADDIDKGAEAIKKAKQYSDDMQKIWRDGFAKIVTDGFKSFQDFFEDVYQLASKLMDRIAARMKELGKDAMDSPLYKLLGIGGAAAAGASAGYGIGSSTGSASGGAFGGAAVGVMSGAQFGAPGMIIGGLAGAVGGLLGAAKAHQEAAKQLREAAERIRDNIAAYVSGAQGDDLQSKLIAEDQRYSELWHQLGDLFDKGGISLTEFLSQMKAVMDAHDLYKAKLVEAAHAAEVAAQFEDFRAQQDLRLRALRAQGLDDEAEALQRQLEVQDAINAGRSEEYVALLKQVQALEAAAAAARKANDAFFAAADAAYQASVAARNYAFQQYQQSITDPTKEGFSDALNRQTQAFTAVYNDQIKVLRDQLKVQQDAQKTAQQSYSDTKRALDSLTGFRSSLNTGQFSVLSPAAQVAAARQQVEAVFRQAQLGDKSAAGNFGGVAQSYLDVLRNYGASGSVFTSGQADITKMADALVTQYGVQASIDQQMLDSANHQVDLLTQQVDLAQRQIDAIDAAAKSIQKIYDKLAGVGGAGTIAGVWDSVVFGALSSALGGAPGGLTNSNPLAIGPSGLPFGNTSSTSQATLAERFFYAFQQFLQSQAPAASPAAVVDATEENTDVLRAGFDEVSESIDRVAAATEENARQIKLLASKIA